MAELDDIFNFLVIAPNLTTSGQPTEDELRALADAGYEVIINLALHDDPRYALPDETGLVKSLGMAYVHIPVLFDAPARKDLEVFFLAMAENQGKKIHVHCAANLRVTAFMGLFELIKKNKSEEAAMALMTTFWNPDDIWAAFIHAMMAEKRGP